MQQKVFENPLIKDKVTVLKTSGETNGQYLLVEVELAAGGGNSMHYHTTFDETFIPVEGVLGVDVGKKKLKLQPGEKAIAVKNQYHRFYNPGSTPIRFQVRIAPGINQFIEALAIGYGLARDGQTNKNGIPKKLDHLAVLLKHSDTRLPGLLSWLESFLMWRAVRAERKGVKQALLERYCR